MNKIDKKKFSKTTILAIFAIISVLVVTIITAYSTLLTSNRTSTGSNIERYRKKIIYNRHQCTF